MAAFAQDVGGGAEPPLILDCREANGEGTERLLTVRFGLVARGLSPIIAIFPADLRLD